MSNLHYEWNDLAAAETYAREGLQLSLQLEGAGVRARNAAALAQALWAQGRPAEADEALREAEQVAAAYSLDRETSGAITACRARFWLAQAATPASAPAAARWVAECDLSPDGERQEQRALEYLVLARLLLAAAARGSDRESLERAQALLARLRRAATARGRNGRLIAILALQALAGHLGHEGETALAALAEALRLAEPEGFVRTFLDEGLPMVELLNLARSRGISPAYVGSILAAAVLPAPAGPPKAVSSPAAPPGGMRQAPPPDGLSPRELEVLRLMEAGLSNDEIARALVVALSTVKAHVNHIFAKLDVRTRTQALARARSRGLL